MTDSDGAGPWSYVGPQGEVARPPEQQPGAADAPLPTAPRPDTASRSRRRTVIIAIGLVVLVVAAAAGVVISRRPSVPKYPSAWDARIVDLVAFVERERKLTFKHPVQVDFLADAEFERHTDIASELDDEDREALRRVAGELRAFGLVSGELDAQKVLTQLTTQGAVGVYIPKDKRVYMRGTELTPKVRGTLVHELTHALQDQYFDLRRIQDAEPNATGVVSLIEGDAVRIEALWADALPPAEAAGYVAGERQNLADANLEGIPPYFLRSFSFPYLFGPTFVAALVASSDQGELDAAFRDPPSSEAEIIQPSLFLDKVVADVDPPRVADPDKAVGKPLEFGLATTLFVLGASLGYQRVWTALDGWRGDNAQSFRRGDRDCMAVAILMDSDAHARALADVVTAWAQSHTQATTVREGKVVELRSCDPGAGAPAEVTVSPDPFEVLRVRSALLAALVARGQLSASKAECGADAVIAQLGPEAVVAVDSGSATAEEVRELQEVAAGAAGRC